MKKHSRSKSKKKLPKHNNYRYFLLAILIATVIAYLPSLSNEFTNWDDTSLITENPLITELNVENVKRIFSEPYFNNYQPLHILSYAVEYQLYQLNPKGYHIFSLLLHLINCLLVFSFIKLLSKGNDLIALFVCALFALHPMHVESVAWASERKDLLYTLFFILAAIAYLKFVRNKTDRSNYVKALLFFLLSAFSKAMAVSLVPVLFLIDLYEQRRITGKLLLEKVPFLALALIFGLTSIWAASESIDSSSQYTFVDRIFFAANNILMYIAKLIVPFKLSAFYPYPAKPISLIYYLSLPIVLAIAVISLLSLKKNKHFFFGISFFVVTIFLVLMLIPVGPAIFSERYTYISSIGLYFAIGMSLYEYVLIDNKQLKKIKPAMLYLILTYLLFCSVYTFQRCKIWKNSFTLWENVVEQFPTASNAYQNLGDAYYKIGDNESAINQFSLAISHNSNDDLAFYNRGNAYANVGEIPKAQNDFNAALRINQNNADAYNKRGITHAIQGNMELAMSDYNKALELRPAFAEVYYNIALGKYNNGNLKEACEYLDKGAELADQNCIRARKDLCK